jgi:hypothetical protein
VLIGADIGTWVGGLIGGFAAALLAIPVAGAAQIIAREIWKVTGPERTEAPTGPIQAESIEVSPPNHGTA